MTPFSNLWVLPAGVGDEYVLRTPIHDRLAECFAQAREEFDFVLVDTAPIMAVTDSLIICQYVDCVLLSVLREVSRVPMVKAAIDRLHSFQARILGAVVANVRSSPSYSNYPYVK